MSQSDFRYVVARAPLRITFTGGGTDLPSFYRRYGPGAVVSAAINRYIYVTVARNFYPDEYRISYSITEDKVKDVSQIRHPTVRESLKLLGINKGIQVISVTEIPSRGTGLGSSSSFLVALLLALHTWLGENVTPEALAREAVHIEREVLKEPGGRQDQYMAAYGGINLLEFSQDDSVRVKPIVLPREKREELESSLIMFYTARERPSTVIHEAQAAELDDHVEAYKRMRDIAYETADAISYVELERLGKLMNENWSLKRGLANGITDGEIDDIYERGMRAGAVGGKLMGAGGGGFMLFLVPKNKRQELIKALSDYRAEEFRIDPLGARVVYAEDYRDGIWRREGSEGGRRSRRSRRGGRGREGNKEVPGGGRKGEGRADRPGRQDCKDSASGGARLLSGKEGHIHGKRGKRGRLPAPGRRVRGEVREGEEGSSRAGPQRQLLHGDGDRERLRLWGHV